MWSCRVLCCVPGRLLVVGVGDDVLAAQRPVGDVVSSRLAHRQLTGIDHKLQGVDQRLERHLDLGAGPRCTDSRGRMVPQILAHIL